MEGLGAGVDFLVRFQLVACSALVLTFVTAERRGVDALDMGVQTPAVLGLVFTFTTLVRLFCILCA